MSGEIYVQDFAALETLFKRFYKPLRAYAFRFVNDKDLSEDIVQDVFYELWKRRESSSFFAPERYWQKDVYLSKYVGNLRVDKSVDSVNNFLRLLFQKNYGEPCALWLRHGGQHLF